MTEETKHDEMKSEAQLAPKRAWGRIAKPLVGSGHSGGGHSLERRRVPTRAHRRDAWNTRPDCLCRRMPNCSR